ncbi:Major facilitator superfamily domain, general substrate transporter [Cordyceps fumosorosea ARSEF 2679]|uniref:Major facilitator superfamily domain, general substrate transporter n=1 Tax=Cordyceps fumosorosea (strain ARSEF 2679) TaxID=1081104 RepID=A0A168DFA3_CORFA|nr:Major facilitator superfamily domain, general substrate transporter [Cordyceps fumosorosea ARSEF 2679]OAA72540.1 Major facilitator superfamily domain, general substrate transporter [Cordyceps fumosorosea ARSEF 2679]
MATPSSFVEDREAVAGDSTERTPLLSSASPDHQQDTTQHQPPANGVARHNDNHDYNGHDEEQTIIAEEISTPRLLLVMGSTWVGVFLGAIDSTIIATLSGPIASDFRSLSLLSWLASAYFIANAASQPISGRLTDIFGRGPGLILSNVLFAAGNLVCGLARDPASMITGRVIAGVGGGGLMSISTFLASDLVPLRKRGIVQGLGNVAYGSGAMLGGVFGGLVNDHSSMGWRLAFLVQVPPIVVSGFIVWLIVDVPPKQSDSALLSRIDFGGVLLTVSFLVLMLLGLNSGGNLVPWTHPLPLVTIPLSLVLFGVFLWWESTARQPVIPVRLLADRTVFAACMTNFLVTMLVMTGLFYGPLFLQILGSTATTAGLQLLPSSVGASFGSVTSGLVMKRTGRYWVIGIACTLTITAGVTLFALLDASTPVWVVSVSFFLSGSGYGAMLTVTLLAAIAAVDHAHQAVVTSGTYMARSIGSTLGVTIGSAVYQNVLRTKLWERFGHLPGAAREISRIRDSLDELKHLPPGWHDGVIQSFVDAFHAVALTMLGLALAAVLSIALMREHKLHNNLSRN